MWGSRRGRPRMRWLEDVQKDVREVKFKSGDRRQSMGKKGLS